MSTPNDPARGPSSNTGFNIAKNQYNVTEQLVSQLRKLNEHLANQTIPGSQDRLQAQLEDANARQPQMQTAPRLPPDAIISNQEAERGAREQLTQVPASVAGRGRTGPTPIEVGIRERFRQARQGNAFGQRGLTGFLDPSTTPRGTSGESMPRGEGYTGVSPTASIPMSGGTGPANTPSITPGMTQADRDQALSEGMQIPQFGEWQLDTKLQMARDTAVRLADRFGNTGAIGGTANMAAGVLNYGYQNAARLTALNRFVTSPVYQRGIGMQNAGAALGYDPNNGLGASHILGFRNPLSMIPIPGIGSEAAIQGFNMDTLGLGIAARGGLSFGQGKDIVSSLAQHGFSGNTMDNLGYNLSAGLVKQGMTPEVAAQFADVTRNGNVSIQTLSDSLKNFGQVAREIREPINQAAESLLTFANTAQNYGATRAQGVQTGTQFSTATGLDPQILGEAYSNPLYQGVMMSQYGIMPSGLATADTGTQTSGMLQTLKLAMTASSGLNQNKYRTINGVRVEVQSGRDAQIAQAAQLAGIQPEVAKRLLNNQGRIAASSNAEALLNSNTGFAAELRKMTSGGRTLSANERRLLESGGPNSNGPGGGWVNLQEIEHQAKNAGVSAATLRSINKDPLSERGTKLEEALRNVNKQKVSNNGNTIALKFTGTAAKYFQQDVNATTLSQNAGNSLTSADATSIRLTQAGL